MLAELRLEREQIEEAILTLERLARGRGRRRGRPPAWLKDVSSAAALADARKYIVGFVIHGMMVDYLGTEQY